MGRVERAQLSWMRCRSACLSASSSLKGHGKGGGRKAGGEGFQLAAGWRGGLPTSSRHRWMGVTSIIPHCMGGCDAGPPARHRRTEQCLATHSHKTSSAKGRARAVMQHPCNIHAAQRGGLSGLTLSYRGLTCRCSKWLWISHGRLAKPRAAATLFHLCVCAVERWLA